MSKRRFSPTGLFLTWPLVFVIGLRAWWDGCVMDGFL